VVHVRLIGHEWSHTRATRRCPCLADRGSQATAACRGMLSRGAAGTTHVRRAARHLAAFRCGVVSGCSCRQDKGWPRVGRWTSGKLQLIGALLRHHGPSR
jgi:hypothetical protein